VVRIRLARAGAKKSPFYRIVAADKRMKRDGRFLEKLGTYNPLTKELIIVRESVEKWLSEGASASDTVVKLLNKEGFNLKSTFVPKPKKAPKEEALKVEAPKEAAPVEEAPKEAAPVEEAPKEAAPVEEAPKEAAPVEETPVEEAVAEEAAPEANAAPEEKAPEEEKTEEA
jgi:small subunit ribosomal protein S16